MSSDFMVCVSISFVRIDATFPWLDVCRQLRSVRAAWFAFPTTAPLYPMLDCVAPSVWELCSQLAPGGRVRITACNGRPIFVGGFFFVLLLCRLPQSCLGLEITKHHATISYREESDWPDMARFRRRVYRSCLRKSEAHRNLTGNYGEAGALNFTAPPWAASRE